MDPRQIQVEYTERDFPGQVSTLYRGPLDEAPSLAVIRGPILEAGRRGETRGVISRNGESPADAGRHRWSWWVAQAEDRS